MLAAADPETTPVETGVPCCADTQILGWAIENSRTASNAAFEIACADAAVTFHTLFLRHNKINFLIDIKFSPKRLDVVAP
jgi:hypothetical protein